MPKQVKESLVHLIYFILAASALLVFWQVRNFDFANYDDNVYVFENQHVLNGITGDGIIWSFATDYASNWHPLTWLSLMLDCQLFGPSPGWMHLMNLFFHLANTLLLFAVLKKMTGSLWPSAFVAAVFALHPMHVESVVWITERKDVLSTFFLFLTMWAYVRYVEKIKFKWYLAAIALFILGLMAKPMLVTLPFLLLLLDYWPLNRLMPQTITAAAHRRGKSAPASDNPPTLYRIIIEKIPFFILASISSAVTFLIQRSGGAVVDAASFPLYNRFANALLSYVRYIAKMFWPRNLTVFYPFNAASIPFWQVAICALLLLVISVLVVYLGRNQRYLTLGWFWFVGTLIPVIGIVRVGSQAYADRYTYIPYIGLFIMLAWLGPQLLSNQPQRKTVLSLSMILSLVSLGICAYRQVSYWNNNVTLFSHAIEVTQNNWLAYNNLGAAYSGLGRDSEAIDACQRAIKIRPDCAEAYNNLGNAYSNLSRYSEAIDAFNRAIEIKPDYAKAYNNLGVAYGGLGRYQQEIEVYQQAIKIRPDYAQAYNNLGAAYTNLGRYSEAIDAYQQAIKIRPDYAEAHYNLGYVYFTIGNKKSALTEYNILELLNPQFADELLNRINKLK
jgi:Flp pilus assembly protein TadD